MPSPAPRADIPATLRAGETPEGAEEGGIIETVTDASGKVIRQTEKLQYRPVGRPAERPGNPNLDTGPPARALADGGYSGTGTGVAFPVGGCGSINVFKTGYTALGFVAWKFHVVKGWCSGWLDTVVNPWQYSYVSNMDLTSFAGALTGSGDYFYSWLYFNAQSGHATYRQQEIDNCVTKYGCIGAKYPWVSLHAHGDGSYQWSRGQ